MHVFLCSRHDVGASLSYIFLSSSSIVFITSSIASPPHREGYKWNITKLPIRKAHINRSVIVYFYFCIEMFPRNIYFSLHKLTLSDQCLVMFCFMSNKNTKTLGTAWQCYCLYICHVLIFELPLQKLSRKYSNIVRELPRTRTKTLFYLASRI